MKKLLAILTVVSFSIQTNAKMITKSVEYKSGGVSFLGYLAYDDSSGSIGKVPGILVVPEFWGLNEFAKRKAESLATMGYVAFVADMYGGGTVTDDPKKAGELAGQVRGTPLLAERARAGLDQLMTVDRVDKTKLAAIGFCFGGSAVQALAYTAAPLAGIASFHGGPINAPSSAAGVKTKFLIMNGAIDPTVKPDARAALEKSLEEAKIDYQSIDYAGAVHAFTNPDSDKIAAEKGMTGTVAYNKAAAERSWQQMKSFFDEIFKSTSENSAPNPSNPR